MAALPNPSNKRVSRRRGGFTLLEIVVSILLTAIMISALLSVTLSTKVNNPRIDHNILAGVASRQLSSQLRNYVTAYWSYQPPVGWNANMAEIAGPNGGGAGPASWSMPGDSCGGCYALQPGLHTLTGYLPPQFEAAPYNARINYQVKANAPYYLPQVNVWVNWTEP